MHTEPDPRAQLIIVAHDPFTLAARSLVAVRPACSICVVVKHDVCCVGMTVADASNWKILILRHIHLVIHIFAGDESIIKAP